MRDGIRKFRSSRKKYIVTVVLAVMVIALGWATVNQSRSRNKLVYNQCLDEVAATVNGTDLTLRQVAFYVAYEESQVEDQARIYNPDDTGAYWELHIDGQFVKLAARNAAIQMAVHDQIFYEMALADGVELTDSDQNYLDSRASDFWSDLVDRGGDTMLGVTEEDIQNTMYKVTIAQKYQVIYENLKGADTGDYDFSGANYEELLGENKQKIHASVWERVDFGNVTYTHE